MRVAKDKFYTSTNFHMPSVVRAIVEKCNSEGGKPSTARYLVAKRIKNIALRAYSIERDAPARFDPAWEEDPAQFIDFVLSKYPDGMCSIRRKALGLGFTASTIVFFPPKKNQKRA